MNRKLKLTVLVILGLIKFETAFSQHLSLDSLYLLIDKNPSLLAYEEDIRAKDSYATGARSLDAPRLSAGQYQTPYQLRPSMGSFMITAEQQFTNPAKLRAKENYMKGLSLLTADEKKGLKNQLVTQARDAYYGRVILEKKGAVLRESEILLNYILKDAKLRLTYGKEQLSNIYNLSAEIYSLKNMQEQVKNEIDQKNSMLNTLMSRPAGTVFTVDTVVEKHSYEEVAADSSLLVAARSDIRAINSNVIIKKLAINMETDKRLPDFGLQIGHMFSYGGARNQYILMGSVTLPFMPWSSHEYKANLKGMQYELQELADQKQNLYNQAAGIIAGLKLEIASKKRQRFNYEQHIIPALTNSYKTALLAYEQNTGDLSSVLMTLKTLQNSRLESLSLLLSITQSEILYERENEKY